MYVKRTYEERVWRVLTRRLQLLQDHLSEMFSVVYTPTEGDAIQNYSKLFRRPEGCFVNIHDVDRVHDDLARWGKPEDIDYIVVTGMEPEHCIHNETTPLNSP